MRKSIMILVAVCGLAGFQSGEVYSNDDQAAKAYEAFATPGAEHAGLAKLAGKYTVKIKAFGKESTGTCTRKLVLNGLFLQEDFSGSCPVTGGPFAGLGLWGFDNAKKKYVSTWADSAGSGLMVCEGTLDGRVYTFTGETTDPLTGKAKRVRSVLTVGEKSEVYELFEGETRIVEVTYTRA